MNGKIFPPGAWLKLLSALILLLGVASAALVYHRAAQDSSRASGYEAADGTIYPIMPGDSKLYRHNLEVYGGKFGVMLDDFRRWFLGLWQGKSLAVMIAAAAIMIALALFSAAHHHPRQDDDHQENGPDGAG
jgi:hypothetical protein